MIEQSCDHCRGAQYVFEYWLEKLLEKNKIHMTDIPPEIFEKIPIEYLQYCHCNPLFMHRRSAFMDNPSVNCLECNGTSWRFSLFAEEKGFRWHKISSSSFEELKNLTCEYFERCPCGQDEQGKKPPEKRKILQTLSDLLKIPRLAFNPFV